MSPKTAPTAPAAATIAALAEEPQRSGKDTGEHDLHRHLEVSDSHGMVATADVTISPESERPIRASLRADDGHLVPGIRTRLVDAVLNLPELHHGARLQAAFPLGDSETLFRFQQRCTNITTHPAGTTVLLEATIRARCR